MAPEPKTPASQQLGPLPWTQVTLSTWGETRWPGFRTVAGALTPAGDSTDTRGRTQNGYSCPFLSKAHHHGVIPEFLGTWGQRLPHRTIVRIHAKHLTQRKFSRSEVAL